MTWAVGIDVGGTKTAAGLVDLETGVVGRVETWETPTRRGGRAALDRCVAAAARLAPGGGCPIGIGLCEFVDNEGRPVQANTIDWQEIDFRGAFAHLGPVYVESDVRAAGVAEALMGAGRPYRTVIYLSVGTGISYCLLQSGVPYRGAHGHAIGVGAPPIETMSSGAALSRQAGLPLAESVIEDPIHVDLVAKAADSLGLAIAMLVNALDPEAVVIGGGLGLNPAYRRLALATARRAIDVHANRDMPIVPAELGIHAGILGAALCARERDRDEGGLARSLRPVRTHQPHDSSAVETRP